VVRVDETILREQITEHQVTLGLKKQVILGDRLACPILLVNSQKGIL